VVAYLTSPAAHGEVGDAGPDSAAVAQAVAAVQGEAADEELSWLASRNAPGCRCPRRYPGPR